MITKSTQLVTMLASRATNVGAKMHTAAYEALGLDFAYIPIETDDIERAVAGIRGLHIRGSSISVPHKQTVMPLLDRLDPTAEVIGAVNTVVNDDGILTGYNSDWIGANEALKEVTELAGKKAIVIGAGGAARAIVFGLVREGAEVSIYDRTEQRAVDLAKDLGAASGQPLSRLPHTIDYDILINATSVGYGTQETIADPSLFRKDVVVMDVVFMPTETTFLRDAKAAGATTVGGSRMLLHQAAYQVKAFTENDAPIAAMSEALTKALQEEV